MKTSCLLFVVFFLSSVFVFHLPASFSGEESAAVEVLEHSWKIEEEWERIRKTKYSWKAQVKNKTRQRQKVSVFYVITDEKGLPLDRNMTTGIIPPGETLEIRSDSYLDNNLVELAAGSTIKIEANAVP